jgi:hypothetical protein
LKQERETRLTTAIEMARLAAGFVWSSFMNESRLILDKKEVQHIMSPNNISIFNNSLFSFIRRPTQVGCCYL